MRPNSASPKPISGYAYGTRQHWQESSDEDWDQELYTPTGDEKFIGVRSIDGSRVNVWRSGREYVAQLEHMTRNHKGLLHRNARYDGRTKRAFITYDVVTPESAEQGDAEERGYADTVGGRYPQGPEITGEAARAFGDDNALSVEEVLHWAKDRGPWRGDHGTYYDEGDPEEDYRTGETTSFAIHFEVPEGDLRRIERALNVNSRQRRNGPPPPPVRRRRRPVDPSLRGVRSMVEREERPFDPDARYPRETKRHHFAINPRGTTGIPAHLKELRVEEPEFNGQDVGYSTYNFGKARSGEPQWYEVGYATGSDYSGGTVELSNYRVLKEMLEEHHPEDQKPVCWVIASGGYSTFSIAVLWDELDDEVKEALVGLEDYPLLDEDAHSELEMKLQDEAWEENYREEFKKEVTKIIDEEEDEDGEWPATDDDAYTLFQLAMETSNENWSHENLGSWPHVDLERVVRDAVKIVTGEIEEDWFTDYDERSIEAIRKGFELEVK